MRGWTATNGKIMYERMESMERLNKKNLGEGGEHQMVELCRVEGIKLRR